MKRNAETNGLKPLMLHSVDFIYWMKMVMSLPYVPSNYVADVFNNIVVEYLEQRKDTEEFQEFQMEIQAMIAYLERTWIGTVRVMNRRTIHTPPQYPISLWNHHDTVLEGKETSNNHVEGFNSGWNKTMPAKPTFLALCEGFVHKESLAQLALREDGMAVGGNLTESNRSRKKKQLDRQLDLQVLASDWEKMRREDYLDCLVARVGDI